MDSVIWWKSSRSSSNGENCVEVAVVGEGRTSGRAQRDA
ncbi:DUF397 domain-containing protein [Actinoallomurus sp. NPDC052274]